MCPELQMAPRNYRGKCLRTESALGVVGEECPRTSREKLPQTESAMELPGEKCPRTESALPLQLKKYIGHLA